MASNDGPTREQFVANPLAYALPASVPASWVAAGWEQESFRDAIIYVLARSVSKVGGFGLADHWLQMLSGALDRNHVADLYVRIRDESQRLEYEWRPAFVAAFPTCELPPSQDDDVVVGMMREMVDSGRGVGFEGLVDALRQLPAAMVELDPMNPDSLLSRAKAKGRLTMLAILDDARRAIHER